MKDKGITQAALAESAGLAQPTIWRLTSGKAQGSKKITAIASALGVRPQWLVDGKGPMSDDFDLDAALAARNPKSEIEPTRLKVAVWEDMQEHDMDEFVEIPLINVRFSAGPGNCEIIEDESFSLIFRRYSLHKMGVPAANARLVRISGDSMYPSLDDGDVVGINMAETEIKDGKTYAICHDDMLRVKTLASQPGKIIIRSVNREEYPDEVMERQHFFESVKVIGKVFWSSHMW